MVFNVVELSGIISYPLFASVDTTLYPHAASRYHARPQTKRVIAMLSMDKFPYPRKQTRGNEFIPCSKYIWYNLKRFRNFEIPAMPLKAGVHHCINTVLLGRIAAARKVGSGRDRDSDVISDVLSLYILRRWRQMWDRCIYFTVVSQSEARVSTEHGIKY